MTMNETNINNFKMLRLRGTPRWAEFDTVIGIMRIRRPKDNKVFIPGDGFSRYVATVDMDNHFVALNPHFDKIRGSWFAYCSCGSPAVVVGYNAYKRGASVSSASEDGMVSGEMLVCYYHAQYGKHMDGSG